MNFITKKAIKTHQNIPPNWYEESIKKNVFQRFWHQKRANEIKKYSNLMSNRILDIGCADGYFSNIICESTNAKEVIGIDILNKSINYARTRYKNNKKLRFFAEDAHDLSFKNGSFDTIYMLESLEHVIDPRKVLKEVFRVLKPDGHMLILVPSENLLFKIIWFIWTHSRGSIWKGTHIHKFNSSNITSFVNNAGFTILENKLFLLKMLLIVKAKKINK